MTDEQVRNGTPWSEVGDQFQALGETIARALRATWERDETRRHVSDLQTGLEALVSHVEKAIADFGTSDDGHRVRASAEKAANSAREAGEKAWDDAQPHIVSALRQVNAELQKVTSRLEGEAEVTDAADAEAE